MQRPDLFKIFSSIQKPFKKFEETQSPFKEGFNSSRLLGGVPWMGASAVSSALETGKRVVNPQYRQESYQERPIASGFEDVSNLTPLKAFGIAGSAARPAFKKASKGVDKARNLIKNTDSGRRFSEDEIVDVWQKMTPKINRYTDRLAKKFGLSNTPGVEEIGPNSLMDFYKKSKELSADRDPSSYIYKIAHNNMVDFLKKNPPGRRVGIDDISSQDELATATFQDMNKKIDVKDTSVDLRAKIEELPKKYRRALTMREIEGMSYKEIAKKLRKPTNTVSTWIKRGRRIIKKQNNVQ